ncbi:MAG: hypothetical protein ABJE95_20575 [Byssovorax sp.]
MRKHAQALIGGMVLLGLLHGCTRRQSQLEPPPTPTASDAGAVAPVPDATGVASSTVRDAAADALEGRCDVMRRTGDATRADGLWPQPADRPIEQAIRRFYASRVLARRIDDRSLARHPVVFQRGVTASGVTVAPCVDEWRAADPDGIVPSGSPRLATDHQYVEVTFELNDASDGENAYTAFVDVATLQVVAMFHYNNFQP